MIDIILCSIYAIVALLCFFVVMPYLKAKTTAFITIEDHGGRTRWDDENVLFWSAVFSVFWIATLAGTIIYFIVKGLVNLAVNLFDHSVDHFSKIPEPLPPPKIDETKTNYRHVEYKNS